MRILTLLHSLSQRAQREGQGEGERLIPTERIKIGNVFTLTCVLSLEGDICLACGMVYQTE